MKIKFLPFILSSLLLVFAFGCNTNNGQQSEDQTLDVYFIAGQSNAAGCSDFYRKDGVTLNLSQEYASKADMYKAGFDNILYFGNAYDTVETNAYIVDELTPVKACMGVNEEYEFGAELGMAEYLSQQYEGTDKKALIIKYAVCGAGLITDSVAFGEWNAPGFNNPKLGNQPDLFARMVGTEEQEYRDGIVYAALQKAVEAGFNDINFKGFYWSQGCAEIYAATTYYDDALMALVEDFRSAIGIVSDVIAMETQAYFNSAEKLPFIISEIAPTQENAKKMPDGTSSNALINSIVEQQRFVADNLENVKTLPTADYDIVNQAGKWASSTDDGVSYCADQWHYNGDDMLTIGNKVAQMFSEDFDW